MNFLLTIQKILVIGSIIVFIVFWNETSLGLKVFFLLIFFVWLFAQYQGHRLNELEKTYNIQEPNAENVAFIQFFCEIGLILTGLFILL